jgi:integrase
MASLQFKGESWYCQFMYKGQRHTFTVGKVEEAEAHAVAARTDYWLMRLKQNLVTIPTGCSLVDFVRFDGKPPAHPPPEKKRLSLAALRDDYFALHAKVLDPRTVADMRGHWKHLARLLGEAAEAEALGLPDLQNYVMARVGEGVEPATAQKEVVMLRTSWNWGLRMGMLKVAFPNKGLRFPKGREKPPFMTFAEVERRVAAGASPELWESVFLTRQEIEALLKDVAKRAAYRWIPVMFWFTAHTGARRSEMLRALKDDVDLEAGTVLIREKKRRRDVKESTRRVPLSDALRECLRQWLVRHPGGPYLFCHAGVVARSKKRSRTTGHQGEKTRASTLKGRRASVKERPELPAGQLSRTEASDHFRRTLAGTKWQHLPGWHCLRHSFVSNCAAAGVDQRLIDAWVGHTTEDMRRRYRHLIPGVEQQAMKSVFG